MIVQCTWKATDSRDVTDAVSWSSTEEKSNTDLEDEIQAESCLLLVAPHAGSSDYLTVPACQLLISCQPPNQIEEMSILTEARIMEVYGHHGEYLQTVKNELLEEAEDMAVFKGHIKLRRPLRMCSIKFACLRTKNEMWLYGVKVITSKMTVLPDNQFNIQLPEVEKRLQEMGLSLSDNADAFKQLMESQKNMLPLNPQDLVALMDLLKLSNQSQIPLSCGTNAKVKPECLPSTADLTEAQNCNNNSCATTPSSSLNNNTIKEVQSTSTQTDESPPPNLTDELKAYIDQKTDELDKQLWEKIQKRFQETEAKLLCKLDEIECFVKPQGVQ